MLSGSPARVWLAAQWRPGSPAALWLAPSRLILIQLIEAEYPPHRNTDLSSLIMPSAASLRQPRAHPGRPLRLLHTSDVHLESDTFGHGEKGKSLRESI